MIVMIGVLLTTIPLSTDFISLLRVAIKEFIVLKLFLLLLSGESSSGKLMQASIFALSASTSSISNPIFFEKLPWSVIIAALDALI